jgi:hypothetical protein
MGNLDVVKILGVGLSGFGFLLMYLAYRLIGRMISQQNPNSSVLAVVNRYMLVSFVMTVTVGVFTYITTAYKNNQLVTQSKQLDDQAKVITANKAAVELLASSQKSNELTKEVVTAWKTEGRIRNTLLDSVRAKQVIVLDTISNLVDANGLFRQQFADYRQKLLIVFDSLHNKGNYKKDKIDQLVSAYGNVSDSIVGLSSHIAMIGRPDGQTIY